MHLTSVLLQFILIGLLATARAKPCGGDNDQSFYRHLVQQSKLRGTSLSWLDGAPGACVEYLLHNQLSLKNPCSDLTMRKMCQYTCATCGNAAFFGGAIQPAFLGSCNFRFNGYIIYDVVSNTLRIDTRGCDPSILQLSIGDYRLSPIEIQEVEVPISETTSTTTTIFTLSFADFQYMAAVLYSYSDDSRPVLRLALKNGQQGQHLDRPLFIKSIELFEPPSCGALNPLKTPLSWIFCRRHQCSFSDCRSDALGCDSPSLNLKFDSSLGACVTPTTEAVEREHVAIRYFRKSCYPRTAINTADELEALRFCTDILYEDSIAHLILSVKERVTPLAYTAVADIQYVQGHFDIINSYGFDDLARIPRLNSVSTGVLSNTVRPGLRIMENPHMLRIRVTFSRFLSSNGGVVRDNPKLCMARSIGGRAPPPQVLCSLINTNTSLVYDVTQCKRECPLWQDTLTSTCGEVGKNLETLGQLCGMIYHPRTGMCATECLEDDPSLCSTVRPAPSKVISTVADLRSYGQPTHACGLELSELSSSVTPKDLSDAFAHIQVITGDLIVRENPVLFALDFFKSLEQVTRIVLSNNDVLASATFPKAITRSNGAQFSRGNHNLCSEMLPGATSETYMGCASIRLTAVFVGRPQDVVRVEKLTLELEELISASLSPYPGTEVTHFDMVPSRQTTNGVESSQFNVIVAIRGPGFQVVYDVFRNKTNQEPTINILPAAGRNSLVSLKADTFDGGVLLSWDICDCDVVYELRYRVKDCFLPSPSSGWSHQTIAAVDQVNQTVAFFPLEEDTCYEYQVLGIVGSQEFVEESAIRYSEVVSARRIDRTVSIEGHVEFEPSSPTSYTISWPAAAIFDISNNTKVVAYEVTLQLLVPGSSSSLIFEVEPSVTSIEVFEDCSTMPQVMKVMSTPSLGTRCGVEVPLCLYAGLEASVSVRPLTNSINGVLRTLHTPALKVAPREITSVSVVVVNDLLIVSPLTSCLLFVPQVPPTYLVQVRDAEGTTVLSFNATGPQLVRNSSALELGHVYTVTVWSQNMFGRTKPIENTFVAGSASRASGSALSGQDMAFLAFALTAIILIAIFAVIVQRVRRGSVTFAPPLVDTIWEIKRSELEVGDIIGIGAFGQVHSAMLRKDGEAPRTVAVKQCAEEQEQQQEFLAEASVMKRFSRGLCHRNVIRLIGQCTRRRPVLLVLEYAANGDLHHLLQAQRDGLSLPLAQLTRFALDIASGMSYLTSKSVIHRDLATRNCLVADDYTVKISDYGLARFLNRADYYRKLGDAQLPIRWMSPEALLEGVFTHQSDIWSYGVCLWEIWSLGAKPFGAKPANNIFQEVLSGIRLGQPDICPNEVFQIIIACWHCEPEKRPTFQQAEAKLTELVHRQQDGEELVATAHGSRFWLDPVAASKRSAGVIAAETPSPIASSPDNTPYHHFNFSQGGDNSPNGFLGLLGSRV